MVVPFHRSAPYPANPAGLPEDVARELEFGLSRAFPRDLAIAGAGGPLWLRYHVGLEQSGADFHGVTIHTLVGWITDRGQRVGMVKLDEWGLPPNVTDACFFDAADACSRSTQEFANALLHAWPIRKLAEHGTVVELTRVWMHPDHAMRSIWAAAVRALIRRRYAGGFSALLLNTWPADYKAAEAEQVDWRGFSSRDRYRTALGRLAQRTLDVRPLPDGCPEDDRWWFWRPLRDGVPKPRRREPRF